MPKPAKTDAQIIDYIFKLITEKGSYAYMPESYRDVFLKDIHPWDIERIFRKLKKEGYIEDYHLTSEENPIYKISDLGMEVIREYGSFAKYLKYKKRRDTKKDRWERIDRNFKNGNLVVGAVVTLAALYIGLNSNTSKSHQQKLQQEVESVSKELDSLKQDVYKIQKQLQK